MLHARILTYLDEVVRQGSIRKAAEKLNVAPSAISRQIMTLEEKMGVPLLDRNMRPLAPTAAGDLLIRHIRDTVRDLARTQAMIEELKGLRRGLVRLAVMSGLAPNIVPSAISGFAERNPRVELKVSLVTTGDRILDAIEAGDADLGLGFDFTMRSSIRTIVSATGKLGAVMAPDHPLARERELRLAACASYPVALADDTTAIYPYITTAFERLNLQPRRAVETNSIEVMRHVAMIGQTITFLTPFDIESDIRAQRLVHVPVHELAHAQQRLMLVEAQRNPNAISSIFAETLKTLIAKADPSQSSLSG